MAARAARRVGVALGEDHLVVAHGGLAPALADQHRRLALAVDDHGGPAGFGRLDRLAQDDRDRLALEADPVVGERHHPDRGRRRELREARQVGGGQDGGDAGQHPGRRGVDAAQPPGGDGRADQDRVQHPGGMVVGGVAGRAGQLQRGFHPLNAGACGAGTAGPAGRVPVTTHFPPSAGTERLHGTPSSP